MWKRHMNIVFLIYTSQFDVLHSIKKFHDLYSSVALWLLAFAPSFQRPYLKRRSLMGFGNLPDLSAK